MNVKLIAQKAGVSTATVSRVLNQSPRVSPGVRAKVWEVIHQEGWTPNPAARTLSRGKTHLIGIVLPGINTYFEDPVEALNRFFRPRGYGLVVTPLSYEKASPEQEVANIHLLSEKQVDGIVFFPTRDDPQVWEALKGFQSKIPVVILGKDWRDQGFSSVFFDDAQGMSQLLDHLIDLGRRKVAFIGGSEYDRTAQIRRRVWDDYRAKGLLVSGKGWNYQGWFEIPSGYKGAKEIWETSSGQEPPDALVAANDMMALGALRYFRESGIRVPEDVALAGFDGLTMGQYLWPRLTTVRQDTFEAGRAAGELLLSLLEGSSRTLKSTVVHHELLIEESTGGKGYELSKSLE